MKTRIIWTTAILALIATAWGIAQDTPGLAGPLSAALLGTNSAGKAIAITLGTNLSLAGTTLNASGGGSATYSCGGVSATMTGSDITMCTFTIPANTLTAGSCFYFQGLATGTVAPVVKLFFGATQVSNEAALVAYPHYWITAFCNDPGSQTTQTLSPMNGATIATWGYGSGGTPQLSENQGSYPVASAIDMTISQTFTVKMNAASGPSKILAFKIY